MPPDAAPAQGLNPFARSNDDPVKILAVALTLCLVCAILVSSAAVLLKPVQQANQALAIRQEILRVAGFEPGDAASVEQLFQQHIQTRVLDLDQGSYREGIDPQSVDPRLVARDPASSRALPPEQDPARIRRRPDYLPVYLVTEQDQVKRVVLPVYGYGLWSTLYGLVAFDRDGRTITGVTFYEHGETPGLGDFITDRDWQAQFSGKLAFDDQGQLRLRVARAGTSQSPVNDRHEVDGVDSTSGASDNYRQEVDDLDDTSHALSNDRHEVDGVAGATLTTRGVDELLRYWLGEQGFGRYLARLRATGGEL